MHWATVQLSAYATNHLYVAITCADTTLVTIKVIVTTVGKPASHVGEGYSAGATLWCAAGSC